LEYEKDPKIQAYMARAGGHDDTSQAISYVEGERKKDFDWAAVQLRTAGPSFEGLKAYAENIGKARDDYSNSWQTLEGIGLASPARAATNPDVKLRQDFQAYVSKAQTAEEYGQRVDQYHKIIGDEMWNNVLVPQLVADRDPMVQQWQTWDVEFDNSGYYDLNDKNGAADTAARQRFRQANPRLDAIGYLLGRYGTFRGTEAQVLAQKWYDAWVASGKPEGVSAID
jgi:hypothetical protein